MNTWSLKCIGGRNDGATAVGIYGDVAIHGYNKTQDVVDGFVIYRPFIQQHEQPTCKVNVIVNSKNCANN